MKTFTHNPVIAAALVCAALVTGARADDVAQLHVKYDDLNVGKVAGATVLYQRIEAAAEQVCGADGERKLARQAQFRACVDGAVARAVATIDAPTLTGLHQRKVGGNTQLATTGRAH